MAGRVESFSDFDDGRELRLYRLTPLGRVSAGLRRPPVS